MMFRIIGGIPDKIEVEFEDYIFSNWVNVIIYKQEQKEEIVEFAKNIGLNKTENHTFKSIVSHIKHTLGCESWCDVIFDELKLNDEMCESLIIHIDFDDFE